MKFSVLLSVAATACVFSSTAYTATLPSDAVNLRTCLSNARTSASVDRCHAIANCMEHNSSNAGELQECLFKAEETYRIASEAFKSPPPPGYDAALPPPREIQSSVTTTTADSRYEQTDRKGYNRTDQE